MVQLYADEMERNRQYYEEIQVRVSLLEQHVELFIKIEQMMIDQIKIVAIGNAQIAEILSLMYNRNFY